MPRRAAVWSYIYYWVEWTFFGHNVSRAVMKRDVSSSARSSFAFIIIIIIIVVIEVVVAPLTAHAVPRTEGAPRVAAREPATAKSCVCRFMTGHNRCWPVAHHVTMAPPLEISLERHRRTASFLRGTIAYIRDAAPLDHREQAYLLVQYTAKTRNQALRRNWPRQSAAAVGGHPMPPNHLASPQPPPVTRQLADAPTRGLDKSLSRGCRRQ